MFAVLWLKQAHRENRLLNNGIFFRFCIAAHIFFFIFIYTRRRLHREHGERYTIFVGFDNKTVYVNGEHLYRCTQYVELKTHIGAYYPSQTEHTRAR